MTRITLLSVVAITASLLLIAFMMVRQGYGPEHPSRLGASGEYLCTNPDCGVLVRLGLPPETDRLADWFHCPRCGKNTLAVAERCNSCGALIPRPPLAQALTALCPACGRPIYGGPTPTKPSAHP